MPIYEYVCRDCDLKFEKLVLRAGQEVRCPDCAKEDVQKLISACNFGSRDGSVQASSNNNCSSCTASSCASCGSR